VEISAHRPVRIVDVVDYGRGSLDPVIILVRAGDTGVRGALEEGTGLVLGDVREMPGVIRDRALQAIEEMRSCGIRGVLEVGDVGHPILGVPVQPQNFGIVMAAGINPLVAALEAGVPVEFNLNVGTVDWASLRSATRLQP